MSIGIITPPPHHINPYNRGDTDLEGSYERNLLYYGSIDLSKDTIIELTQSIFDFKKIYFTNEQLVIGSSSISIIASFEPLFNKDYYFWNIAMEMSPPSESFAIFNAMNTYYTDRKQLAISTITGYIDYVNPNRVKFNRDYSTIYRFTPEGMSIEPGKQIIAIYGTK